MAAVKSNPAFRKTAAATQLGKALFSKNSQVKITPAQITNLLRMAGVNVPPSVSVSADVAQIIMAGGMIISNVDRAASIGSYAAPTALAIQAAVDILTVCGLADANSPMMQLLKYGAETAAVVSSAGTNVVADLSLALDTYQQVSKSTRGMAVGAAEFFATGGVGAILDEAFFGSSRLKDLTADLHSSADLSAKQKVYSIYTDLQKNQASAAAYSLLKYQAGKISVFDFMGTVAENDPLVFYNYFPDLQLFIPPNFIKISVSTEIKYTQTGGMFNLATRDYDVTGGFSQSFTTTTGYTKEKIIEAIVNYFLNNGKIFEYLQGLNFGNVTEKRISMGDLACLSMFPPHFENIDSTMNLAFTLRNLNLTPHDLGYAFVEDMKTNFDIFPELKNAVDQTPAVTLNGVEYMKNSDAAVNKILAQKRLLIDQLVAWDMMGDIRNLSANPTGKIMIQKWGDIYGLLAEAQKRQAVENIKWDPATSAFMVAMVNAAESAKNIKNYFSILSIANVMKDDRYVTSTSASKKYINDKISWLTGTAENLDDRFRDIQFLSLGRMLNLAAFSNIAGFFGKSADKIKLSPLASGKLSYII